jgi:hypothetical protein
MALHRGLEAVAFLAVTAIACSSATDSAETRDPQLGFPNGWGGGSSVGNAETPAYFFGIERGIKRSGSYAGFIEGETIDPPGFGTMSQFVKADRYRGKRIRFSGWVWHKGLTGEGAGLWMRVDGPGVRQQFDNMAVRRLRGDADWHEVAVVLDVPANAIGIALGVLSIGTGAIVFDDLQLEVVGLDVGSTNMVSPAPSVRDSATTVADYARSDLSPVNLDFESGLRPAFLSAATTRR